MSWHTVIELWTVWFMRYMWGGICGIRTFFTLFNWLYGKFFRLQSSSTKNCFIINTLTNTRGTLLVLRFVCRLRTKYIFRIQWLCLIGGFFFCFTFWPYFQNIVVKVTNHGNGIEHEGLFTRLLYQVNSTIPNLSALVEDVAVWLVGE